MGSSQAVLLSWGTSSGCIPSEQSRTEPSSTRFFLLLENFFLWFEIVLDWQDFLALCIKRIVKNWYRAIRALHSLCFRYIKFAQYKIFIPTDQALQCLMPNAVLAIHSMFIVCGKKWLPRKSCVLCGSCLVWTRRHGHGSKLGIFSSALQHGSRCLGHTEQIVSGTYSHSFKGWGIVQSFPPCSWLQVRAFPQKAHLP